MTISGNWWDQQAETYRVQNQAAQDRARLESSLSEIALREAQANEQRSAEQWAMYKKQADTSGQLASQFLSQWGGAMSTVQSMFGDASQVLKGLMSGESGGAVGGAAGGLSDISKLMRESYDTYQKETAPIAKEFLMGARETAQQKRAVQKEMLTGTKTAEQAEGAAGRAYTDVMVQSEQANAEAARKMMSMGLDPSGGAFGALNRRGAVDTAGAAVGAMNVARREEKNRLDARSLALMSALSPSEEAGIATNLMGQGRELLSGMGALETSKANLEQEKLRTMGSLGSAYANMAGSFAQNFAQPYSELAGYYLGKSGGAINPPTMNTGALAGMTSLARPTLSQVGGAIPLKTGQTAPSAQEVQRILQSQNKQPPVITQY